MLRCNLYSLSRSPVAILFVYSLGVGDLWFVALWCEPTDQPQKVRYNGTLRKIQHKIGNFKMGEEEFINQIRFMFSSEEAEGVFDRMGLVPDDRENETLLRENIYSQEVSSD